MTRKNSERSGIPSKFLGFLLLGAISYGIYLAFRSIFNLEGEVQAAILTFLGAFAIWLVRSWYEARRDEKRRGYEHRREVYLQVVSTIQGIFNQSRQVGHATSEEDMVSRLRDASNKLYLEGSDSVYQAFRRILTYAQAQVAAGDDTERAALLAMRSVHSLACCMLEMRKDVGFKRTTLSEHDYLRQLLSDYDKHREFFDGLSCSD